MHARTHCGCGDLHEANPTLQAALTGLRGLPKRTKEKKKEDMKMGRRWVGGGTWRKREGSGVDIIKIQRMCVYETVEG